MLRSRRPRRPSLRFPGPSIHLLELRAAQRTFEGAYLRTALSQFSFALIVLKVFSREFYPIGALFAAFGAAILGVAWLRRKDGNVQLREEGGRRRFRTSGNVVALVSAVSVGVYAALVYLIWNM
jgi:uncharacterized membrane protein YidH (DUF202 family)